MPARSRAAAMARPPRSVAGNEANAPESLPIGVRAPATMTEPGIGHLRAVGRRVECTGRGIHQAWPARVPLPWSEPRSIGYLREMDAFVEAISAGATGDEIAAI